MEVYYGTRQRPRAYVNMALVACNVIVFIILELLGSTQDVLFMVEHGASFAPYILEGGKEYLRLLYSVFLHFGPEHLFHNMIGLFFIGDNLERAMGHIRYLIFYLLCGIGASVCSMTVHVFAEPYTVSAGASGAICGVVGGLLWVVIANRGRLEEMTTGRVAFLIFYLIYGGLQSSGVDNIAHISGALLGFILSWLLYEPSAGLIWGRARAGETEREKKENKNRAAIGLPVYIAALWFIVKITQYFVLF